MPQKLPSPSKPQNGDQQSFKENLQHCAGHRARQTCECCMLLCVASQVIPAPWYYHKWSLVTCHYSFCHHQSLKKSIKKASKRISNIVHALVQAKVAKCCMLQVKAHYPHNLSMNESCLMPQKLPSPSKPQTGHQQSFKENFQHCAGHCAGQIGQSCEMPQVASQAIQATWS